MPRNDYKCLRCGHHAEYEATRATAPWHCDHEMTWFPTRPPAVDAKEPFQQASLAANGKVYPLNSLHDIRAAERDSEQMARNGEGQPLVWRDYAQEKSNQDRHTLATRMDRSMDTQEGFAGGMTEVDKAKVGVAKGADVAKRQGL
jgi:hypothetical protein